MLCFWAAYVVTRPLGASFADYFGKPKVLSGLDYGEGPVSALLLVLIAVLVGFTAVARYDIQQPGLAAALPMAGAEPMRPGRLPERNQALGICVSCPPSLRHPADSQTTVRCLVGQPGVKNLQ